MAATHGLSDVFDPNYNVPGANDPDYNIFTEKNTFVYSIFISRVTGGMALLIIRDFEATKDVRGIFMKFRDIYECASNVQQMALMAMQKLNNLTVAYNTNGGIPVFITKFRDNLNDLKDTGQTMHDVMAKSLFLGKIQDRDFAHIVDRLMDSTHSLEHCMQRVLDKFNLLDAKKDPKGRHANSAKKDEGKRNRNDKQDKGRSRDKEKGENRQSNNTNTKDKPKKGITYRSEEHTSELQSLAYLVCRLL